VDKVHVLHLAKIQHIRDGQVIWEDGNIDNVLHDAGAEAILSAYFATGMSGYGPPPPALYLGLDARTVLTTADVMTTLVGEPVGNGYARKAQATNGTGLSGQPFYVTEPGAYYEVQGIVETWIATAVWSQVTNLFLSTISTGTDGILIASVPLSAPRTLQNGDNLNASIYVGLSN
jgi:hypothetical protein